MALWLSAERERRAGSLSQKSCRGLLSRFACFGRSLCVDCRRFAPSSQRSIFWLEPTFLDRRPANGAPRWAMHGGAPYPSTALTLPVVSIARDCPAEVPRRAVRRVPTAAAGNRTWSLGPAHACKVLPARRWCLDSVSLGPAEPWRLMQRLLLTNCNLQ